MRDWIIKPEWDVRKTAWITGPRKADWNSSKAQHEIATYEILANSRIERVLFGGAWGTDSWMLSKVHEQKQHFGITNLELVVVCPNTIAELISPAQKMAQNFATGIIELGNPISAEDGWRAFLLRNEFMVDHARFGFAFPVKGVDTGGTIHCMRYARTQPDKLLRIFPVLPP